MGIRKPFMFLLSLGLILLSGCTRQYEPTQHEPTWQDQLNKVITLYGHRNWILIVDMAYPLQSNPAIQTLYTGADQLEVTGEVLKAIKGAPHIDPEVFLDKEIDFVPEAEAPGIEEYKKSLTGLLKGIKVEKKLHEEMIAGIDEAAKTFNVLVLKTDLTIPYTSVFIRLNCGYWKTPQEEEMRQMMEGK